MGKLPLTSFLDDPFLDEQTFQSILAKERENGVDYEKIEKSFLFVFDSKEKLNGDSEAHQPKEDDQIVNNESTSADSSSNDKLESIYIPYGYPTPSQSHNISLQDELQLRCLGSEMIIEAGCSLKLPWYTVATAQAIFQRFFYRVSFLDHDIKESLMACLFIATKIEESPKKLREVVTVCYHIFKIKDGCQPPIPVLNPSTSYYHYIKQLVIDGERYVLKELGFELYRLSDHPHRYLLDYLKRLRASKDVAKKAWNYANDSYRGTLCVHYPPHIIAVSCLYLAMWSTDTPIPQNTWWAIFDTSIKHILEVSSELLSLYEQPKTTMTDLKRIMDALFTVNSVNREYTLDNEEEFNRLHKEAREKEEREAKENKEKDDKIKKASMSTKHSTSRDVKPSRGSKYHDRDDRRRNSREYRDKSPYRRKKSRDRTKSRSHDKRKGRHSRSRSKSNEDRKKRKYRDRSRDKSEERSPSHKKRSSRSGSRKKKRDRSKERRKDKERERSRDKDEKSHKKKKDKHKDKDGERSKKKDKDEERSQEKMKSEQTSARMDLEEPKAEKKVSTEVKPEKIVEEKSIKEQQIQSNQGREATRDVKTGSGSLPPIKSINAALEELKRESLGISKEYGEQTTTTRVEPVEQQKNGGSDSDEDDEKLLELKRKIMQNKKNVKK